MTRTIDGIFYDNMNAAYDAIAKKILARKVFLARIIKRCIKGFEDCSFKDIEEKYIEGEPEIGIIPVSPDRTNAVKSVKGDNVEYKTLTEGETVFDIRTTVFVPKEKERIKIIINLEAQKKHNPGYSLIKRGMFHLSRLMSSEYNVEFTEPNFNDIKKVVSIWICMTAPNNESSIMDYSYAETAVVGNVPKSAEEYDLMQLVMIYLGSDNTKDKLLKLLHLVFKAMLPAEEKKSKLRTEYDIEMDNLALKEANIMCNLSEGIYEEAWDKSKVETTINHLKNILKNSKFTLEQAMDILEVPTNSRSLYTSMIANN